MRIEPVKDKDRCEICGVFIFPGQLRKLVFDYADGGSTSLHICLNCLTKLVYLCLAELNPPITSVAIRSDMETKQ